MSWKVEYLAREGVIELVVAGSLVYDEIRQATDATLEVAHAEHCQLVLLNCQAMSQLPAPSIVQKLPEYYAARGMDSRLRIGLVSPDSTAGLEVLQFYKLAARRQNFAVQLFESRNDALQWLCN